MNRQYRIWLAQVCRSQAADAHWAAICTQAEFSPYDARRAR